MSDVQNLTVLGAGNLGAQIAMFAAYNGKNVVSYDINDDALKAAEGRFENIAKKYRQYFTDQPEEKITEGRQRITQTADLAEAVKDADLIIEAVPEKTEIKNDLYGKLAELLPEKTIVATNTSTFRPSDFAELTGRPEKYLAMHFANDIHKQNIVEIMPTGQTDPEVFKTAVEAAEEFGMVPIELNKEHPGYVINTLFVPWLENGAKLWTRGITDVATVEKVARIITEGDRFTPFRLFDVVGFGVSYAIESNKTDDEDSQEMARRLKWALDNDYLGVENGKGFYLYDDNGEPTGLSELATRDWSSES
ncbi:3-hydroxyacyl-CoA dehydrogenase [Auritidibacter ignavus]|uniref:3-hydroxyacyl-CoA dehydrogenase n=1 Tax=Auritidibacter ignavus TaxID=678932 RepID=UPI000F023892|nr:3-hydroxyacyl-CoA dehydrogenase [Auritidibacter ignavus]NIH72615.1 3-hydroxybutyryl-CoA dehydrogenase [Auritidibacter ignavus]RMX23157.1 3-hydroxyacyl-CoA dehydrogenase [Auritidibacter ignavus]WGH90345.1 3-hydroxyacyl-CoA dehydrogenase [Auritidibacter ignavus]